MEAQERLLKSCALILGVSSHGGVAAHYLAQSGVGRVILVDENPMALSNIYRRVTESPLVGMDSELVCKATALTTEKAEELIASADVVIDGLNNWQDKLIASDACMHLGKPLIHAGGIGFRFQLFIMRPSRSACLRCALPQVGIDDVPLVPLQSANLAPVIGMIGAWQAVDAIKLMAKLGASQANELTRFDWLSGEIDSIRGLDPRPDCPDCGRPKRN